MFGGLLDVIGSGVALSAANNWTGKNTFSNGLASAIQSFTENGGTIGTISATGGSVVEVTGSGGGTLSLPAGPGACTRCVRPASGMDGPRA